MEFLLDPSVTYLNHGSYGACPRPVHETYQQIQRQLELQPVRFMQHVVPEELAKSRRCLAEFVNAEAEEVVFVRNPTYAVNEIARSLHLGHDDEVLLTDQEYGACHNAWRFMSQKRGFQLVRQPIPLGLQSDDEIVEHFWRAVSPRTKAIFCSQITSPTAMTIPVADICRRARERGIMTLIDGAHAPGQLDVDLKQIGADFYTATCHKWMCAPKGSAFFYCRRDRQPLIEPLIVGWGWGTDDRLINTGNQFIDYHEWLGTSDPAAYLTVPTAIEFQRQNDWHAVRERCHQLAVDCLDLAEAERRLARVHPNNRFQQMALVEILSSIDAGDLKRRLDEDFRVEVPVIRWNDRLFVRASFQAYNSSADVQRLLEALTAIIEP